MINTVKGKFKNHRSKSLLVEEVCTDTDDRILNKYIVHFIDVERLGLKDNDSIEGPYHPYKDLYREEYKGYLFKGLVKKVSK